MISAQASSHPVFKLPFLRCNHEYAKSVYSSIIIIYARGHDPRSEAAMNYTVTYEPCTH